ncbi:hypothetical protein GGI23_002237 [Coemansia sp. RSA 2559]|nr:hypothetical protein GGI23_002237 [Coemansia sp. RSA 2559]
MSSMHKRISDWLQGYSSNKNNSGYSSSSSIIISEPDSQPESDMYESAVGVSSSSTEEYVLYDQWRDAAYLQYIDMRERLRIQVAESDRYRIPREDSEQLGYPWPRNDNWTDRELTMMHQIQGYEQNISRLRQELREAYEQQM